MVYPDLQEIDQVDLTPKPKTIPIENRLLTVIFDFLFFSPLVSFLLVLLFKESYFVSKDFTDSVLLSRIKFELFFFGFLYYAILQSLFIYFTGTTPGHRLFKLQLKFEDKDRNYFARILFRQLGYVFSIFLLGLPYLAILLDKKHKPFYDKMTDCELVSLHQKPSKLLFVLTPADKKFLATGYSLITSAILFLVMISFILNHQEKVHSYLAERHHQMYKEDGALAQNISCVSTLKMSDTQKMKSAMVLNISKQIDDECVLDQADQILDRADEMDTKVIYLAYLAKWYVHQKTDLNQELAEQYFEKMCEQSDFSYCQQKPKRSLASEVSEVPKKRISELDQDLLEWLGE
jgi:RDD family